MQAWPAAHGPPPRRSLHRILRPPSPRVHPEPQDLGEGEGGRAHAEEGRRRLDSTRRSCRILCGASTGAGAGSHHHHTSPPTTPVETNSEEGKGEGGEREREASTYRSGGLDTFLHLVWMRLHLASTTVLSSRPLGAGCTTAWGLGAPRRAVGAGRAGPWPDPAAPASAPGGAGRPGWGGVASGDGLDRWWRRGRKECLVPAREREGGTRG
jgi:hypothetical protein